MRKSRTAVLRAQLNAIAEELARIESRPEEPVAGTVIRFDMRFEGPFSKAYDYAAIRAGDGLWYTTGPRSPKGYNELLDWMEGNTGVFQVLRGSRSVGL